MPKKDYTIYTKKELIERIHALEKRKKYGLVWDEEKTKERFEKDVEGKLPVLVEVKENEIRNDENKPTHILIEGDNYHALSVLNYTHAKKIDVIYIDPPYNTGNSDFKFNDKFVDREDSYRHSKWLSFMSKRLKLAKKLLKHTGVIFISIDNNEVAQLKLLCQDIFGEENFISDVAVINNLKGRSDDKYIATAHEHLLIFKKKNFETLGVAVPEEYVNDYKLEDTNGKYRLLGLRKRGANSRREDRPNLFYPFYYEAETNKLSLNENDFKKKPIKILPKLSNGEDGNWRWGRETASERINELVVSLVKTRKEFDVSQKDYLHSVNGDLKRIKPKSFWMGSEFSSDAGTKAIKEIIPDANFNNPKAVDLIKFCLEQSAKKKSIILDFFSGSGTTLQSTLKLNSEDKGNRQCILVTNNENNICTDVCYPRVKKVINGYKNTKGELVEGLGGNLKYFKTAFVPAQPTDKNKELLTKQSVEMLCLRENTFDFVKETEIWKLYRSKQRHTGILFDQTQIPAFKKELVKLNTAVSVYVFSLGDDDFADDFAEMKNVKVCSIPEAILRVYRKIFK